MFSLNGLPSRAPRNTIPLPSVKSAGFVKCCDGAARERHRVLASRLRAFGSRRPHTTAEIDLVPRSIADFAGSGGSEGHALAGESRTRRRGAGVGRRTGEIGDRIDVWRKGGEPGFSLETSIDLSDYAGGGELEIEGLAHNPQTGEFYLSSDETLAIAVVDATGRPLRELTLEDELQGRLKPGRSLSEYRLSGLDYADGLLYAVSEPFNTLFVIDPEHGLLRVLGIENGGPISAIAVRDGTAYLPLDHNWVDPRPPLLAVTLD